MNGAPALLASFAIGVAQSGAQPTKPPERAGKAEATTFAFDADATGKLPDGWKAEGTNQNGPVATWQVVEDSTAPSQPHVLALSKTNLDSVGTFNLCWTDTVRLTDGSIQVKFKPVSGKEDQGGGLIWRVKDKDNYMICRMNPLEDNFRVYYVKDGSRHQVESAKAKVEAGTWHTMRIEQHGEHIVCFLDGKEYLNAHDDHIRGEGGVGLWTKSDAVSSFDDLIINPGGEDSPGSGKKHPDGDKDDDDDDDRPQRR